MSVERDSAGKSVKQDAIADLERPDEAVQMSDEQAEKVVGGRLSLGGASDPLEQEADRIADHV